MPRTRRVTMDEWAARVAAWQRSEQSAVVFCKARGWDPSQLRWWRWKLERRGTLVEHAAPKQVHEHAVATPNFLRLVTPHAEDHDEHAAPYAMAARCELVLRDGRILRFDDLVAPERLRALADALEVDA